MSYPGEERRKYIRLSSVFPVEFSLIGLDGSKKYQGFTHDISKGGLCIRVREISPGDLKAIEQKKVKLSVNINISKPLFIKPIKATCSVGWFEKTKEDKYGSLYSIGTEYLEINPRDRKRIINYARKITWGPRVAAITIAILLLSLFGIYLDQSKIKQQNQKLVAQLVEISEKRNNIYRQLNSLNQAKILLERSRASSQEKIKAFDVKKAHLQEQLSSIEVKSSALEEANIRKMRDWISTHRNRRTGLVLSYEGDKGYEDWAFTYDQALAVQVFLLFEDVEKASAILDFYNNKAQKKNGLFFNAYDAQTGKPFEYTTHSGPNTWIAISACKFTKHTNDNKYLQLAEDIADKMLSMQRDSDDGGIKGGPGVSWVSTEHNMDAYALFTMLYEITQKYEYRAAKKRTFKWLKASAYNKSQGRFNRGKGDSTIATDTFSWAIASIGPKLLKQNRMDPDGIMEFAEDECKVQANFQRPDGESINVIGFDFAKATHLGRGGVVSCEWTAQMVVSFKIMANYHQSLVNSKKASAYSKKGDFYLTQLSKMVISSPSPSGQGEGCLPYASMDNVDTGHGWRVAKGRRTGSLSATIFYIFAQRGYNPLKL